MRRLVLLFVLALAACGDDGPPAPPFDGDVVPDGPDIIPCPTCWAPMPGQAKDWDVQLTAPFDISAQRAMYDLDLFDVVPSPQTLSYPDGDLQIPAGVLPTAIADLHAKSTIVVCHVGAGLIDTTDPDAAKFPTELIGKDTDAWQHGFTTVRSVDYRDARVLPLVEKRFDLAKQIGCDAVEPDGIDSFKDDTGFTLTEDDEIGYFVKVAAEAHRRELSVGMKNVFQVPNVIGQLTMIYDWMLTDRCAEFDDCGKESAFIVAMKAVFAIDILKPDASGGGIDAATACGKYAQIMIDGIIKDDTLTKTLTTCP